MSLETGGKDHPLDVFPIEDVDTLAKWEYWLKLSYSTANLHIVRGWTLVKKTVEDAFEARAQALRGPILYSFLDLDSLKRPQSFEDAVKNGEFKCNWVEESYPTGALDPPVGVVAAPTGSFGILVCKVAAGATLVHQQGDGDFATREIPSPYSSVAIVHKTPASEETKVFRVVYRVKRAAQVLPVHFLEFEFRSLVTLDVSPPSCEVCEVAPATVFCPAEKCHLCVECDHKHHTAAKLLSRHKRLPVTHCFVTLCPHCILIGSHSSADFSEHPLISTLDAYKMSMQGSSPSEEALEMRERQIVKDLQEHHRQLARIHSNCASLQRRIDSLNKGLTGELQNLKQKKVGFLQAIKRELLTELLIIEWMEKSRVVMTWRGALHVLSLERLCKKDDTKIRKKVSGQTAQAFFMHIGLTLNPSDFLIYQHRHDLLAADLFGGPVRVDASEEGLPPWVLEELFLEGSLKINTTPYEVVQLKNVLVNDADFRKGGLFIRKSKAAGDASLDVRSTLLEDEERQQSDSDAENVASDDDTAIEDARWQLDAQDLADVCPRGNVMALARAPTLSGSGAAANEGVSGRSVGVADAAAGEKEETHEMNAERRLETAPPPIRALIKATGKQMAQMGPGVAAGHTDELLTKNPLHLWPQELNKELWGLLSDNNFHPLIVLLKSAEVQKRFPLLEAACHLANSVHAMEDFAKKLVSYEMAWVQHLPTSLTLQTSSLLGPFLDGVSAHFALLKASDKHWIFQLLGPSLVGAMRALASREASESKESGEKAKHAEDDGVNEELFPFLKALVDRLTEGDLKTTPSAVRALLYIIEDQVDLQSRLRFNRAAGLVGSQPNASNNATPAAVAMCGQVILSRVFASNLHALNQSYEEELLGNATLQERQTHSLGSKSSRTNALMGFDRLLRELGSYLWDAAVQTRSDDQLNAKRDLGADAIIPKDADKVAAEELSVRLDLLPHSRFMVELARRVYTWMRQQLKLPRLHSPLSLAHEHNYRGNTAAQKLIKYILKLDRDLRDGAYVPCGGISVEEIYSQHFDELVLLALKAPAYALPSTQEALNTYL